MADPMDTLKSLLGDNAEETIQSVMNSLNGGSSGPSGSDGGNNGGADLGALLSSLGAGANNGGNGGNAPFGGTGPSGGGRSPLGNLDPESLSYLMQMRDIVSKMTDSRSDSRSNLLMSLKPYMRDNRKRSIDSAVRLLNISKLAGLFRL